MDKHALMELIKDCRTVNREGSGTESRRLFEQFREQFGEFLKDANFADLLDVIEADLEAGEQLSIEDARDPECSLRTTARLLGEADGLRRACNIVNMFRFLVQKARVV